VHDRFPRIMNELLESKSRKHSHEQLGRPIAEPCEHERQPARALRCARVIETKPETRTKSGLSDDLRARARLRGRPGRITRREREGMLSREPLRPREQCEHSRARLALTR